MLSNIRPIAASPMPFASRPRYYSSHSSSSFSLLLSNISDKRSTPLLPILLLLSYIFFILLSLGMILSIRSAPRLFEEMSIQLKFLTFSKISVMALIDTLWPNPQFFKSIIASSPFIFTSSIFFGGMLWLSRIVRMTVIGLFSQLNSSLYLNLSMFLYLLQNLWIASYPTNFSLMYFFDLGIANIWGRELNLGMAGQLYFFSVISSCWSVIKEEPDKSLGNFISLYLWFLFIKKTMGTTFYSDSSSTILSNSFQFYPQSSLIAIFLGKFNCNDNLQFFRYLSYFSGLSPPFFCLNLGDLFRTTGFVDFRFEYWSTCGSLEIDNVGCFFIISAFGLKISYLFMVLPINLSYLLGIGLSRFGVEFFVRIDGNLMRLSKFQQVQFDILSLKQLNNPSNLFSIFLTQFNISFSASLPSISIKHLFDLGQATETISHLALWRIQFPGLLSFDSSSPICLEIVCKNEVMVGDDDA